MGEWQTVEELPSLVKGCSLNLREMIQTSREFADRWGLNPKSSEPLPEPVDAIPGDGMPVNLVSGSLAMGGAERQTVELAIGLSRAGYSVKVGILRGFWDKHPAHADRLKAAGIAVEDVDDLPDAAATIWWGAAMEGRKPAGSIYVAHSASKLVQGAVARCCADIDRIVGVSRAATKAAGRAHPLVKGSTIWNGVDSFADQQIRDPDALGYVVGYMGRYDTEKGVALAIAALVHTAEDVRLRCYGKGPHKGALASAADEHGVGDRVDICGVAPDFMSVAGEFDALVVPDLVQGFPMTVCEALLNGTPVVGVSLGDLHHVLLDGRGVAVESNPRAIADGIAAVRAAPLPADDWASDHLTADAMAAAYTHVIHEVAG